MFYTYIVASRRNGTLYTGSTDNLFKRVHEHREKLRDGFTAKYGVHMLVWFAPHETRAGAFQHERRIKEWRRSWKLRLIEERNPDWVDLYDQLPELIGVPFR
ncbi:GIY-YIG nuclease family protein [Phenylobacterium sp. LjRoot219]|uniref:GIY-YIG nuclease family protein n=1 Tax=Phenylobacterium sp. LjRoot219 TaxID=3342283 RepID=UPI003ECDF378